MNSAEAMTHSFIVRVWLEEEATEASAGVWRGHIRHVPSQRGRYVTNLDEIPAFIAPYLEDMNVRVGRGWRLRRWLRRR